MDHDHYSDAYLRQILRDTKTIAVVGASPDWRRPSSYVMKYLAAKGYRMIPINPRAAGEIVAGETCFASLQDAARHLAEAGAPPIDLVDLFRASAHVPPLVSEAIAIGAKTVWMQIGVRHDEAAAEAEQAGLNVVMDRCPKIEYSRLTGELRWGGVNTGIISARRPRQIL